MLKFLSVSRKLAVVAIPEMLRRLLAATISSAVIF